MAKLYYVLTVWNENSGHFKSFRLESNFSFPSPIGTTVFINSGNGFCVEVSGYYHLQEVDDEGDFHMTLMIPAEIYSSNSELKAAESPYLNESDYEDVCQTLSEKGWQEFDTGYQ